MGRHLALPIAAQSESLRSGPARHSNRRPPSAAVKASQHAGRNKRGALRRVITERAHPDRGGAPFAPGRPNALRLLRPGVLRASLRIRDRTGVKQTPRAGPIPSLVGAALGRLASSRRCAVSLIRGLRGSAIGRILEAHTAKSSRGACRTLLATRINALPAACVYRAPWIFDGVSSAGPSQGGRRRQSGGYQFSHAVSSPHLRL
jgi:hypothetical protein